jgi:hypothetical protein
MRCRRSRAELHRRCRSPRRCSNSQRLARCLVSRNTTATTTQSPAWGAWVCRSPAARWHACPRAGWGEAPQPPQGMPRCCARRCAQGAPAPAMGEPQGPGYWHARRQVCLGGWRTPSRSPARPGRSSNAVFGGSNFGQAQAYQLHAPAAASIRRPQGAGNRPAVPCSTLTLQSSLLKPQSRPLSRQTSAASLAFPKCPWIMGPDGKPALPEGYAGLKPQFTQIGEDGLGRKQYGFVDQHQQKVALANIPASWGAPRPVTTRRASPATHT